MDILVYKCKAETRTKNALRMKTTELTNL